MNLLYSGSHGSGRSTSTFQRVEIWVSIQSLACSQNHMEDMKGKGTQDEPSEGTQLRGECWF